jgi:hypothetical protein
VIGVTTEQPQKPPTSGPGSGAEAWRAYAAAVTGSPVESWESLSRDEVKELLESEGATPDAVVDTMPEVHQEPTADTTVTRQEPTARPRRRRRPVWMVPTADGFVPETQTRG